MLSRASLLWTCSTAWNFSLPFVYWLIPTSSTKSFAKPFPENALRTHYVRSVTPFITLSRKWYLTSFHFTETVSYLPFISLKGPVPPSVLYEFNKYMLSTLWVKWTLWMTALSNSQLAMQFLGSRIKCICLPTLFPLTMFFKMTHT